MSSIKLVYPTETMENYAIEFKNEFFNNGENIINGGLKLDNIENYVDWLRIVNDSFAAETVNPKWGVTHTFFAIRDEDEKIIGIVNLRLYLTDKFKNSGHIGYSVRPSERRKGYATTMLKQILEYAKTHNMSEVDIVCKSDNLASVKTILNVCKDFKRTIGDGKDIFKIKLQ